MTHDTEYVTARGVEIPALGFGTARFDSDDACRRAVERALDVGYRHLDTAQVYGTEGAVGEAVDASDVDREDVFVTTKLSDGNRSRDRVLESTRESLEKLRMDAVDLLLIHSPKQDVDVAETVAAMNELQDEGVVRHVGVSNFSVEQTRRAMDASETPILANQVEYHPNRGQQSLLEFCIDEDVMLTAYSPLDVGRVADDETLAEIGERHGKSASQVALRWLVQQPTVSAIPKAAGDDHVRENFDVFDFELDDDEMRRVFEGAGGLTDGLRDRLGL